MKLGAVGDEYVQDGEGVCVADAQGAGALAVVVLAYVDGVVRGVPVDGGGDAQDLFDALEHLPVLHNIHEDVSLSVYAQRYVTPATQPLVKFRGATEALDEERGGGHPVWMSKHRGRRR